MSTVDPLLRAQQLRVQLAGRPVVDGVTLDLRPGAWVCVCGPNGAGKSTLLRALAGLQAHQGDVQLLGRDRTHWPLKEQAAHLSWLGQAQPVPSELRVQEVVQLGRWPHRHSGQAVHDSAVVQQCLDAMGLQALSKRVLQELSGGECQRVLLARAMAVQAPVMLFDEPLNHLDIPHQQAWLAWLRQRCVQGAAALTVMHELHQALAADLLLVMHAGRALHLGSPGEADTQAALQEAFGHSLQFHAIDTQGTAPRWVVLPRSIS